MEHLVNKYLFNIKSTTTWIVKEYKAETDSFILECTKASPETYKIAEVGQIRSVLRADIAHILSPNVKDRNNWTIVDDLKTIELLYGNKTNG